MHIILNYCGKDFPTPLLQEDERSVDRVSEILPYFMTSKVDSITVISRNSTPWSVARTIVEDIHYCNKSTYKSLEKCEDILIQHLKNPLDYKEWNINPVILNLRDLTYHWYLPNLTPGKTFTWNI